MISIERVSNQRKVIRLNNKCLLLFYNKQGVNWDTLLKTSGLK